MTTLLIACLTLVSTMIISGSLMSTKQLEQDDESEKIRLELFKQRIMKESQL